MPIYEYEPADHDCLICNGKVEAMQKADEEPLQYCPTCGLEVRRVVSKASFKMDKSFSPDGAAKQGFATYKRLDKGLYERMSGEGVDMIIEKPEGETT
jgi:putative FmdB family regulatory protein